MRKYKFLYLLSLLIFISACTHKEQSSELNGTGETVVKTNLAKNNDFDVIVIGGEPEGVVAAVSAARNGLRVLLIEDDDTLGGLMTLGKLNFIDMNYGQDGQLLTQGIFKEFFDKVGGNVFDVERAKRIFRNMVAEQHSITLKLNTSVVEPITEDNTLLGV